MNTYKNGIFVLDNVIRMIWSRLTSGLTSCLHLHRPHTHSPACDPEQTRPLGPVLHRTKEGGRCKVALTHLVDPSAVHIRARERHRPRVACCVALAFVTNPVKCNKRKHRMPPYIHYTSGTHNPQQH